MEGGWAWEGGASQVKLFAKRLRKTRGAAQAQTQLYAIIWARCGVDVERLLCSKPVGLGGRAVRAVGVVQLNLQVKVPVRPIVHRAGALRAEAAGPVQQLRHFAQQGCRVAGSRLCQSVPTDYAIGVFAAVEFQKLQVHAWSFFPYGDCR